MSAGRRWPRKSRINELLGSGEDKGGQQTSSDPLNSIPLHTTVTFFERNEQTGQVWVHPALAEKYKSKKDVVSEREGGNKKRSRRSFSSEVKDATIVPSTEIKFGTSELPPKLLSHDASVTNSARKTEEVKWSKYVAKDSSETDKENKFVR